MISLVSEMIFPPVRYAAHSIQTRGYSLRTHSTELTYLSGLLISHLERPFPELPKEKVQIVRDSVILPLAKEILLQASAPDPVDKISHEVKDVLKNSICRTMKEIMGRVRGSKKGIMYDDQYYKEVLGKSDGYLNYILQKSKNTENEQHGCFRFGEDFCHFIAKRGIPASDAIQSFLEGPVAADCGTTVEAVYFKAICRFTRGKEKFDALFFTPQ